jgi:preprotein translocase subunit YajC
MGESMNIQWFVSSADGNAQASGSGFGLLIMLVPMLLLMYFLILRPQRKRQQQQLTLQRSVEVGDEVMTTSGVYGFVTGFDGDIAWLEIDDNVQIRIARQAIQRKVDTAAGETATPADDGTGKAPAIKPAAGTEVDSGSEK